MPTDGADFGRTRPCYGRAYTMARDGADNADVAECVMRGVEFDIRRDGGAPAFPVAVDILVLASGGGDNGRQLLAGVDAIRRDYADSPLTRHFAAAVETLGLSAIAERRSLSREQAGRMLLVQVAESRCCDGMTGYVARNRTKDLAASHGTVGSIKSMLGQTGAAHDLGSRMLHCSPNGLPARASKGAPVMDGVGLLVSGQTHSRIAAGQDLQVAELREQFLNRIEHAGIGYGFPDKQRHELAGFESTQRTRAFMHTALGSVAALMAGNSRLFLFENGFGALNLPCDSAQFGSQNSRGTHPVFLRRMAALVSAVFSKSFVIANPFTLSTKAQMLSALSVPCFAPLLERSFSCDRFPNYKHSARQCGCCPSCLIRRLSFHAAGLPDDSRNYSTDIFNPRRPLRETEWLSLSKLTVQADSLALCLHAKQPWPALCAKWPDLLRTEIELDSPAFRESVINLLRRHVDEWRSFSSAIHRDSLALAA